MDVPRVALVLGCCAWARVPLAVVDVSRSPAWFAWGVVFTSIASIGAWAPFACHGVGTFGARYATSYAVVIRLTISVASAGSLSDFSWVALVWRGEGPPSRIFVHVLSWRVLKSSSMRLFIARVVGRTSVRFEVWLLTDVAIVCLFTTAFRVFPGFKSGRISSKTASFVWYLRLKCLRQLWSSPVCVTFFFEVLLTVALSPSGTVALVVDLGMVSST